MTTTGSAVAELLDGAGIPTHDPTTPEGVALRLVAAAHLSQSWDGSALRYWDALAENVAGGREESGGTLAGWWQAMHTAMGVTWPGRREDRALLAGWLAHDRQTAVLEVLSTQTEDLVIRLRVATDARKQRRTQQKEEGSGDDQ